MLNKEDNPADMIKPRLVAADADCSKVQVLTGVRGPDGTEAPFTFADMPLLEDAIKRCAPALMIIDPLQAYSGS